MGSWEGRIWDKRTTAESPGRRQGVEEVRAVVWGKRCQSRTKKTIVVKMVKRAWHSS